MGMTDPSSRKGGDAVWARLREIPFSVSFATNPNPDIRKTLHDPPESGTTILKWMCAGLQLYYADGLNCKPPAEFGQIGLVLNRSVQRGPAARALPLG